MGLQAQNQQRQIAETLAVEPRIDPTAELERRVCFLVDYASAVPGVRGFALGISGGQDSTLAGRIAQLATERLREVSAETGRSFEFIAIRLPYAVQHDEGDAQLALDFIRPDITLSVNIAAATDALVNDVNVAMGGLETAVGDFNRGNVKARMRMIAQYAVASERRLLVIGTDHAAEAVTGFFTKYGDGAADVLPLAGLTKGQGAQLLQHLNAPERLWRKVPTADLLDDEPGQTDESSLGMSYNHIDAYLTGQEVPEDVIQNIESRYRGTEHKRQPPVSPSASWWREG